MDNKQKLTDEHVNEMMQSQTANWRIITGNNSDLKKIHRDFSFPDFLHALQFVNLVSRLAEKYNHHPIIQLEWGKVSITWCTHEVEGLTQIDFDMACLVDEVYDKNLPADVVKEASINSFPASDAPSWNGSES